MKIEEKEAKNKYDFVAEHYHSWRTKINPQGWMYNEFLEMPAMFELLGNIKGKKILDIGCGTGIYAKKMTQRGAIVKGFDISEQMISIARKENPELDLRQGSFYSIPFKERFDIAIAPLIIDYAKNWGTVFKEVSKVLKKRGYFIFSARNPITEASERVIIKGKKLNYKKLPVRVIVDYFNEKKIYGLWKNILNKGRYKDIRMPSYHKTYETIIKIIIGNGFEITNYKDCYPAPESKKLFP